MLSEPATLPVVHPIPQLMEVAQVAHRLNFNPRIVWRLIREGKLKAIRIESRWRIDPADLKAYIDAQRVVAELFAGHQGHMGRSDRRAEPRPPDGPRPFPKTRGA